MMIKALVVLAYYVGYLYFGKVLNYNPIWVASVLVFAAFVMWWYKKELKEMSGAGQLIVLSAMAIGYWMVDFERIALSLKGLAYWARELLK